MGLENTDARGRLDVLAYKLSERVITELGEYWGIGGIWDQCKPHMEEAIRDLKLKRVPEPLIDIARKLLEAKRSYDSNK
jgi:hypothetical protein